MIPNNSVAFTGHYHFFKKVSKRLTVVGNLTPLGWSDIDQPKGWLCWDDETGDTEQIVQSVSPMFISWNRSVERHSDLENVKDTFVRFTAPVTVEEMTMIREKLMDAGALTVQFSEMKKSKKEKKIRAGNQISMESLVEQYSNSTEGRRREVGQEIREDNYEAPEI